MKNDILFCMDFFLNETEDFNDERRKRIKEIYHKIQNHEKIFLIKNCEKCPYCGISRKYPDYHTTLSCVYENYKELDLNFIEKTPDWCPL